MERELQDNFSGQAPPLVDGDEWLLRLHFSPEHYLDGKLTPSAISLADLGGRGFSIDREHLVDVAIITRRAVDQNLRNPEQREKPYLSRFKCAPIRQLKYENKTAFIVEASPTEENLAHAHIVSEDRTLKKGELRQLRNLLLEELQMIIPLEHYTKSQQNFL
jgi:hypothetical protein